MLRADIYTSYPVLNIEQSVWNNFVLVACEHVACGTFNVSVSSNESGRSLDKVTNPHNGAQ